MKLMIDKNGNVHFLAKSGTEALADLGKARTRRASNIEPVNPVLRWAFYAVRRLGTTGEAISRRFPCLWRVNLGLSGGPTYGAFRDRAEAIESEEAWLVGNSYGR